MPCSRRLAVALPNTPNLLSLTARSWSNCSAYSTALLPPVDFRACPSSPQHWGKLSLLSSEQRTSGDDRSLSGNQLNHLNMADLDSVIVRTNTFYNTKIQGNHSIPIDPAIGRSSPGPHHSLLTSLRKEGWPASCVCRGTRLWERLSTHNPIAMATGGLCFETDWGSKAKWAHPRLGPPLAMPVD